MWRASRREIFGGNRQIAPEATTPGRTPGEAPTTKLPHIFDEAVNTGPTTGPDFWAEIAKSWRRRLLLGEDLGNPAKGGGDYSWRRCWRCSEAMPRPSPGDEAGKLTREKCTQPQAMKFCIYSGFFHILAKSPGVPPTVLTWRRGEDLGNPAKGGGDYSWRRCWRCSEAMPRPSPGS